MRARRLKKYNIFVRGWIEYTSDEQLQSRLKVKIKRQHPSKMLFKSEVKQVLIEEAWQKAVMARCVRVCACISLTIGLRDENRNLKLR